MKKIFVAATISILLIAGFFVGQVKFSELDSTGRKSSSNRGFNYSDSNVGGQLDYSTNNKSYPETGASANDVLTSDVIAPPSTTTPVGNPKGNKIIKTGTIEITVDRNSVNKKYEEVSKLLPDGSYVEASQSTRRTSTITVRIPSEKLDETLVSLHKVGKLVAESVNSVDRTYDGIDYDARLKIMREREAVLNDLLKKSATANDAANIQEQIFTLRQQIESLQGQKDVLNEQVALSTLTITLTEDGVKKAKPEGQTMIGKAWTTSANALLTSLGGIMIVFTALLPFLVVGLIGFYVARALINKSKKDKASKESESVKE